MLVAVMLVPGVNRAESPDMQMLKVGVDRAWIADIASWSEYAFDRSLTRQSYDADGGTKSRQDLRFRVTPNGEGGFDELLLEIDGRKPTSGEIKEHRKKGVFTKHFRQADELNLENPLGEDLALLPIIQAQDHEYFGEDEVDGIACHRTTFEARPAPEKASIREMLKYAIKGSACFSIDGSHLVEFEMETVRALNKGVLGMNSLRMVLRGQPVGDAWLPREVRLRSDVVLLGKRIRRSNAWYYSNFQHQPSRHP